jgi:ATP synthase F1 gamma subunit
VKTINEIREGLQFNSELMSLLEVMKSIAIFRFRALQARKRTFSDFISALEEFFGMIDLRQVRHPFLNPRNEKAAIVVITSDEGFMGGLNLRVITAAVRIPEAYRSEIIVVGERGTRHLSDIGRRFTVFRSAANVKERYRLTLELKDHILKGAKEGQFGRVFIFYPRPLSFMAHKIEGMRLLPVSLPATRPVAASATAPVGEVIIESPLEGIIDYLVEENLIHKLIDALEDSKLSEYASRALHLEESNRKLKEKEKGLRLNYFRAYHELIDKNIRELFSAQVIGSGK